MLKKITIFHVFLCLLACLLGCNSTEYYNPIIKVHLIPKGYSGPIFEVSDKDAKKIKRENNKFFIEYGVDGIAYFSDTLANRIILKEEYYYSIDGKILSECHVDKKIAAQGMCKNRYYLARFAGISNGEKDYQSLYEKINGIICKD